MDVETLPRAFNYVNMTDLSDIVKPIDSQPRRTSGQDRREAQLVALVELLFFAYRDFTSDPDAILAQFHFGRAHHRVLHFVDRYPGLRVAQLLDILKITKQSLARVLRELIQQGFIEQRAGASDRRERLLHATPEGHQLARRLLEPQIARIAGALRGVRGEAARESVHAFLMSMITDKERQAVEALMTGRASTIEQEEGA